MLERYEEVIKEICGENWFSNRVDRDGGYGVACMYAFLNGVNPKLESMASHLGLAKSEIKAPFVNLLVAGYFSNTFDARNDEALNLKGFRAGILTHEFWSESQSKYNAWCHVAGVASGLIERNIPR